MYVLEARDFKLSLRRQQRRVSDPEIDPSKIPEESSKMEDKGNA